LFDLPSPNDRDCGGEAAARTRLTMRAYDTRFGRGWISGVVSVVLGALGFGAVLCLRYPALLTTPDARAVYPMDAVRSLIHLVLVSSVGLGVLSIVLVEVTGPIHGTHYVSLDWFCLNLFVLALVFVPL